MKHKSPDIIIGLSICFFSILVFFYADRYAGRGINSYGPDFFPKALSLLLFLCAAVMICRAIAGFATGRLETTNREGIMRAAGALGLAILYLVVMQLIGFLLATIAFLYSLMMLLGQTGQITRLSVSVIVSGLIFAAFIFFLKIPLPEGIIFDSFRSF